MSLEEEFHREMEAIYQIAATRNYRPTYFLRMVQQHGGVAVARRLLNAPVAQSGLTKLWESELLHISMEAQVVQERWKPLFSDAERQMAQERLQAFGYDPPTAN